ncbi:MAG TPA: glycine cleavage system aminomethyltransferase GcvT [Candidatus Sulfotelmatobacter sp.]|nr:glycine cleavage system aminomethyltransferase GcvT [Candidatus Sulfotelmatobacter sp.]
MRRTSLYDRHVAAGARLIEFGGWEMPVQYSGILEEHRAVRQAAGLFDLSHMGELFVSGPGAAAALAYALVSDPGRLALGRAQYSLICAPDGGLIDDLIVYRLAEERYLVVPNAGNREAVTEAVRDRLNGFDAALDDASLRTALLAVQGPRAQSIVAPLVDADLAGVRYYGITSARVHGIDALVARTGYTGEDGFELFVPEAAAPGLWDALLEAGRDAGVVPVGLGARDTLRLEAGMPLYGNELDRTVNPFEAGLARVVRLDKPGDFVGRQALQAALARPLSRTLVGLVLRERGVARHGYPVYAPATETAPTGVVTSGTVSPTLGQSIAMAYVPSDAAALGTMQAVAIRDGRVAAEVVVLPFYARPR